MTTDAALDAPTAPQPWHVIAPKIDDNRGDPHTLAAYWLTYAYAHLKAYNAAAAGTDLDRATAGERHLRPYMMGFTIGAMVRRWSAEAIARAFESGDVASACHWDWLVEYGIDPTRIESAAEHLPRIERRIAEREAAEKAVAAQVPGQTAIEDHLTD